MKPNVEALRFSAAYGVVSGYGHDNAANDPARVVAAAWQRALEAEFAMSGLVIGAVICPALVAYPRAFGCPDGGEVAAVVTGESNPAFVPPERLLEYRDAVLRVAATAKYDLGQARVQVTFSDVVQVAYLQPDQVAA